jgi:glucose 1-dehydrogenase
MTAESDEPTPPSATIPELLAGQKAIVTGGSSGIGKAIALALGEAGTLAAY